MARRPSRHGRPKMKMNRAILNFYFYFFLNKKKRKKNSIGTPRGRASRLLEKVKTFNISEGQHERDEGLRGKRPVRNSPHQLSNFIFQSFDTLRVHLRMQITRWQCNIISWWPHFHFFFSLPSAAGSALTGINGARRRQKRRRKLPRPFRLIKARPRRRRLLARWPHGSPQVPPKF